MLNKYSKNAKKFKLKYGDFVMDYYELQSDEDYIMPQEAYVEMILKTKPSLIKLLQFVYCMENRNECILDEETCKVMRSYMENILNYQI